jgi:hypothetical protein
VPPGQQDEVHCPTLLQPTLQQPLFIILLNTDSKLAYNTSSSSVNLCISAANTSALGHWEGGVTPGVDALFKSQQINSPVPIAFTPAPVPKPPHPPPTPIPAPRYIPKGFSWI